MEYLDSEGTADAKGRASIGFRGDPEESLSRFLGAMVRDAWADLRPHERSSTLTPEFSGVLPLRHPDLVSFLEHPGICILLGPPPSLRVLDIQPCPDRLGSALIPAMQRSTPGNGKNGNGTSPGPAPSHVACVAMEESGSRVPDMGALLASRILPGSTRRLD